MVSSKRRVKLQHFLLLPLILVVVGTGCRVTQEEAGEAPDVEVDPGQLPEYDVEGPDVDVEAEQREVTVPDVDVETEQREITVPDVNVTPPGAEEEQAE